MKAFLIIAFAVTCIAQWWVPGAMIIDHEDVLQNGKIFRFKTAPVDPSDPFRGKYIILRFEHDTFETEDGDSLETGDKVYVLLKEGEDKFARIRAVSSTVPGAGEDYLQAEVSFIKDGSVAVDYPFDRFYLEESKASEAERLYWESRMDSIQNVYAVVRVKDGLSVLEDVMINDRSIVDVVKEMNKQ